MSFGLGPPNTQSSYLPEQFTLPDDSSLRDFISKRERLTASILNIKEIASYEKIELINAQQWFSLTSTPRRPRYSFRKVFDLVALNGGVPIPAGLSSFPHGIAMITTPTRIFGTATTAGPIYLPLPFAGAAANNIAISFDNVNVYIDNGFGADLTQCYVTFEYIPA